MSCTWASGSRRGSRRGSRSRRGSSRGRGATQGVVSKRGDGAVRRRQRGQARGASTGRRRGGRRGAALQPVTQAQAVVNMPEQRRLRIMLLATILDRMTIALQRALWRELLNIEPRAVNAGDQNRHTAYRCYILWQYNRLGAGVRRVIPSCVVLNRSTFPFGQYPGFKRDRLV